MEDNVNKNLDDNNKKYFNEVNETSIDDEGGEETTGTKNQGVIHIYIIQNETETNQDTLNKVIEKSPDEKSPVVMEEYVNKELDYSNHNYLVEENKTEVHDEEGD